MNSNGDSIYKDLVGVNRDKFGSFRNELVEVDKGSEDEGKWLRGEYQFQGVSIRKLILDIPQITSISFGVEVDGFPLQRADFKPGDPNPEFAVFQRAILAIPAMLPDIPDDLIYISWPPQEPPLPAPKLLKATAFGIRTKPIFEGQVDLKWTKIGMATVYLIDRVTKDGPEKNKERIANVGTFTTCDADFCGSDFSPVEGITYEYRILALNDKTFSISNGITVIILKAPSNLGATRVGSEVRLSWQHDGARD